MPTVSSERKLKRGKSADLPGPLSKKSKNFAVVEGNQIIDMKLLRDALTEAHICPEGISLTFLLGFIPSLHVPSQ